MLVAGGSAAVPEGDVVVRLYDGAIGPTYLAQAQAQASLDAAQQLSFSADLAPAEAGRHSSIPPGVWGGNVDNWRAVGDEPCIIFLTARGAVEYLDARGAVTRRSTTTSVTERYRALDPSRSP